MINISIASKLHAVQKQYQLVGSKYEKGDRRPNCYR